MKNIWTAILLIGLMVVSAMPSSAYVHRRHYYSSRAAYVRHRRHMKTAKRVGIGAAGGAAVGALAGGAKGGIIGGVIGAGAGALYDRHKKHQGHY
jgi:outer membrane lipoprotein SlyB